jgi:hypothetical protein
MKPFFALAAILLLWASSFAQVAHHPSSTKATEKCSPPSDTLKCPRFGFTYKIPFGWVDRTDEMGNESDSPAAEANNSGTQPTKSETLLAIFERPPGAPGETINSAVVIATEPLANYHRVKTAADYFGPIMELAEQRGFKVVNEPDAYSVGPRQLVRGDFSKPRGTLTMWQSSLVMIEKGYVVSFTFLGDSEDEVEELVGNLSFASSGRQKQVPHR